MQRQSPKKVHFRTKAKTEEIVADLIIKKEEKQDYSIDSVYHRSLTSRIVTTRKRSRKCDLDEDYLSSKQKNRKRIRTHKSHFPQEINENHCLLNQVIPSVFIDAKSYEETLDSMEQGDVSQLVEESVDYEEVKDDLFADQVDRGGKLVEQDEQAQFFTYKEPDIWYSLRWNEDGLIRVDLPGSLRQVKRLIYIFRNREKKCFLIGKTGGSLNKRISRYITQFNKPGSENEVKKEIPRSFLVEMKERPDHFDVGILHVLSPEEDLDMFETLFITYKKTIYNLYNDNNGGGGGSSHGEEVPTTYAIPNPEQSHFTPTKYYRFGRNEKGHICPQLTPGFKRTVEELRAGMEETQEFIYSIKEIGEEDQESDLKRYIGVTGLKDPSIRARQHGYAAGYCDPTQAKYDPDRSTGYLHSALAENPEKFGFGLLPVQSATHIDQDKRDDYVLMEGIAKVEKYAIELKKSHYSENGFNGNRGGGGPIAKCATHTIQKKLKF